MECYQRAIEQDTEFALAYDSLAELHWFLGFFGNVPPRDAFSASTWHALRALELDDTLAETHALLGMLRKELDYNWPEVDRECHRALDLNPESPLVRLRYAISGLMPHGRVVEATAELDAVVCLDPLSIPTRWWLAVMLYFSRQLERMADQGQQILALDPHHFLGHWVVGMERDAIGAGAHAVAALEKAHELSGGGPFTMGFLAYAYGRAGRPDDARRLLDRAEAVAAKAYVPPSTFALGHVGLDEWDSAFDWWNRAIEGRDPLVMPVKNYLFFDPVRGDSRYLAMLRLMNLDQG
jgi:tetratricopeptide (TPR) repeat protein